MSIQIKNLYFRYNKELPLAIDNISFDINDGDFISIIGETGSGKSTLVQHLNGLLKATSEDSKILVDNENIYNKDYSITKLRYKVGLVFQYPEYQLFETDVLKDVMYGALNKGLKEDEAREEAKKALSLVGISEELYDSSPFDLSGGEKRRVSLAGILVMSPKYLVLDEPAAGLDPLGRKQIFNILHNLNNNGTTIILVSHSMQDVVTYSNRVIVLKNGKKHKDATPKEIFLNEKEMKEIGLSLPDQIKILNILKEKGFNVKTNLFSLDDVKREIEKCLEI
ncbi:MAG: energy-coupling factor transporter ATPase [Eubacteriales bacterium]|nr:energy-coupling factor transporter ATPase [Eubacteriales bacterium]